MWTKLGTHVVDALEGDVTVARVGIALGGANISQAFLYAESIVHTVRKYAEDHEAADR